MLELENCEWFDAQSYSMTAQLVKWDLSVMATCCKYVLNMVYSLSVVLL